jgi:hypothetical protein
MSWIPVASHSACPSCGSTSGMWMRLSGTAWQYMCYICTRQGPAQIRRS